VLSARQQGLCKVPLFAKQWAIGTGPRQGIRYSTCLISTIAAPADRDNVSSDIFVEIS